MTNSFDSGGGGGLASTDIDTSAELAAIITDEVGTGKVVFNTDSEFSGNIGIGIAAADGGTHSVHVHTASAGAVTANILADEFVAEGTTAAGFSNLVNDTGIGYWMTGTPTANDWMCYQQNTNSGRHNFLVRGDDVFSIRSTGNDGADVNFFIAIATPTGTGVALHSSGSDADVDFNLVCRGLGNFVVDGPIVSITTYAKGNLGATPTVEWNEQNYSRGNLTANITTLTFTPPISGEGKFYWKVTQDGTGRTIDFGGVTFLNTAPSGSDLNITPNKSTLFEFTYMHGGWWFDKSLQEV